MARKPAFIRWDREKEARVQSRLLDVLERRFARQVREVVNAESADLVRKYRDLGFVPPPDDHHFRAVRDLYMDMATASARTFGARVVTQGKTAGHVIEVKQEGGFAAFFRALAFQWINLEPVRRRIQSVAETTRNLIVSEVARGQQDGLGVDAIARAIDERTPEIGRWRGALIARTETHGAANFAAHETARSTGLELVKEWVAVEDTRTRSIARDDAFDHASMDGQTREMDEPFDMPWIGGGGEPLKIQYPGEAGKPGGAVINCRCAVVHAVKDVTSETSPAALAAAQGEPQDGFAYRKFSGVRNAAEAELYLKKNGVAEEASLKGVSVKGLSAAIGAAHEVTERFGLRPVAFMGPITRDTRYRYRRVQNANAAVFPTTRAMHLPVKFGDLKDAGKQIDAKKRRAILYERERAQRLTATTVSDDVRNRVAKMKEGEYTWTITAETPELERVKTIYHEYGHVLHLMDERAKPKIDDFLRTERPTKTGWDLLLSKYAGTKPEEYVAESFALYMSKPQSERFRIHPALLAIFQEMDKAR